MLFSYTPVGFTFHIGVGSSVVCSTIPGNAKASVRGTDNKEVPTLFSIIINLVLTFQHWGLLEPRKKIWQTD